MSFQKHRFGEHRAAGVVADPHEINRTLPDFYLYDPTGGRPRAWHDPEFYWLNEQVFVIATRGNHLLATWTAEKMAPHLLRVAFCLSEDGGLTWSIPEFLDGDGIDNGGPAAWQVPYATRSGRIYLFYSCNHYPKAGGFGGICRCCFSDDGGKSWSRTVDLAIPRSPIDHEDTNTPSMWISISVPFLDSHGGLCIAFTRWANNEAIPGGNVIIKERYSHIELMRIADIEEEPYPDDIELEGLSVDDPITVPHESIPEASFAQEPYIVSLPDQRHFMVMRTNRGQVWYTVSDDEGVTWRDPEPMSYGDRKQIMLQCVSPCPIWRMMRGDYVFLFNNNDGYINGATSRWDMRNRRPLYISRGEFMPNARQPIWWSKPKLLIDNEAVPWGPVGFERLDAAAYPSLTELNGRRTLWYPDRKGFLLGRIIADDLLDNMHVPKRV